ncbi:ABC transporter permease [Mycolicibacterium arseniciresistens]|uniref:ABC transporter permease n=1 Tax=Mycolicibacterium arseniciresistens TaxID=3062257 RepID=UPI002E219A64
MGRGEAVTATVAPARPGAPAPELIDVVAGHRRRRGMWARIPRPVRRMVSPVLILAAWTIGSTTGLLNPDLFPNPAHVAGTAWRLLSDGQLALHVGVSATRVLTGTVLGILFGVLLAVLAGLTRTGEDLLDWTMQILKAVPNFALTPLLIIWMGIGEGPKIVLITLGVAIAIYINTYAGIRGVDQQLVEMAQTLEARRSTLITQVILPGAMPNFLVGLRLGLSSAWLSLIFAEMINTTEGIGFLMSRAQTNLQFDVSLLVIVIYAVAGLASYSLVRVLERLLLSWRNGFTGFEGTA